MSRRELARAGTALGWRDWLDALAAWKRAPMRFPEAFARWVGVDTACVVSSGRAAFCLILRALAERSERREVVIPAYTCPTVPLAVARAGLRVRLCDVDPSTGSLDPRQLAEIAGDATLAVVPVHMHGIPCDMGALLPLARACGAAVVEDCAAAAGARLAGRPVGSFGDAAFFSLSRGKGFTAYEGGIAVGGLVKQGAETRPRPLAELATLVKLAGMSVFFHPSLYGLVRALPLGWETEIYPADFPIAGVGGLRQGVALSVLRRLDVILAGRRRRAHYLRERLRCVDGVWPLEIPAGSEPSYPWLPLVVERRDEALRRLRAEGLGAAPIFTRSLAGYDYLRGIVPPGPQPAADGLAERLLSLPTHAHVRLEDAQRMVEILRGLA